VVLERPADPDALPAEFPFKRKNLLPPGALMIVRLFKDQFAPLVRDGRKCQTVRPTAKRKQDAPKPGDVISLRRWTGSPYRSKQELLRSSIVKRARKIIIGPQGIEICNYDGKILTAWERPDLEKFAHADGFPSFEQMHAWFSDTHGTERFVGTLVEWCNRAELGVLQEMWKDHVRVWWLRPQAEGAELELWKTCEHLRRVGLMRLKPGTINQRWEGFRMTKLTRDALEELDEIEAAEKPTSQP
jgi:hypothetical protein